MASFDSSLNHSKMDMGPEKEHANDPIQSEELPNSNEVQMPQIRMGPKASNTGPKGVIADYKDAQNRMKERLINEKVEYERSLYRLAVGEEKFVCVPQKKKEMIDEIDENDDDDLIFQKYKQQRLEQIQYGGLEEVKSLQELVSCLRKASPKAYIILLLTNPTNEMCIKLEYVLRNIASQFKNVQFLKGISTRIIPGFSEIGF